MIIATLKKFRLSKGRKNKSNKSQFPPPPQVIHLSLPPAPTHKQPIPTKSSTNHTSKMASSRTTTSSSTDFTNGYHTPTSPDSFTDHHDHVSSASRQEYARILYEHTMKQMERFAQDAQSRGTLSMDFYPLPQSATVSN
jgi:hypothetical protein